MKALLTAAGDPISHESDLPFLREAVDLDAARFAGAPPGYIPYRNAIFYAAACYHAQALGCVVVVGGHNREDSQLYPDAAPGFFASLQGVLDAGAWRGGDAIAPKLLMPLLERARSDVVALAESLGVPLDATWSCHEDYDEPCGVCPACARA